MQYYFPKKSLPPLVSKEDNLEYCLHNLIATDVSPFKKDTLNDEVTRENLQLLINRIFELPNEKSDEGVFAVLPSDAAIKLPRSLKIPKVASPTKWERFAKEKGIVKRKRSRMVWDDSVKDWVPRWGYKSRASNERKRDVVIELKEGQELTSDLFEERSRDRQIKRTKQAMQELRNKQLKNGSSLPVGVPNLSQNVKDRKTSKMHLKETMKRSQLSTASAGRHNKAANGETTAVPKMKQKMGPKSYKDEKQSYLKIVGKLAGTQQE